MNKAIYNVWLIIFGICFMLFVLFMNTLLVTNSSLFFSYEFDYNNSMETTGFEKETLMNLSEDIRAYLNGKKDNLVEKITDNGKEYDTYSSVEITHMEDVKGLYSLGKKLSIVIGIFILLSLYYMNKKRKMFIFLKHSGLIILSFILIISALCIVDFNNMFIIFHKILFKNDFWILSYDDLLIECFPETFFIHAGALIAGMTVLCFVAILLASYLLNKEKKA